MATLFRLAVLTLAATTLVSAAEDIWGPHIVKEPQDTTFNLDSTLDAVFLECEAEGSPKPQYFWQKDGQNITLNEQVYLTGGRLTLNTPSIEQNRGLYQCFASNKVGTVMSRVADLQFAYVNEFPPGNPPSQTLQQNQGGCIQCNIPDYYPGILVTWFRNMFPHSVSIGQRITHDGRLCFASVKTTDAGRYHCSVGNVVQSGGGSSQKLSRPFQLNVERTDSPDPSSPPTPGVEVADRTALQGEDVLLECFFFGNSAPTIRWSRRNAELPSKVLLDQANQQLRIPEVEPSDAGDYVCSASNDVQENVQIFGTVEVKVPPQWETPLTDVSADIYSEATMQCVAVSPDSVSYEWFLNSESLTSRDRHSFSTNKETLTITNLDRTDTAIYQCVAQNEFGSAFSTGQLTVRAIAPTFLMPLKQNQPAPRNGQVTIQCQPDAAPKPDFQWFKGEVGDDEISHGGRYTIEDNGDLLIMDVVDDDTGRYTCLASNTEGTAESTGSLVVRDGTSIQESPEAKLIDVGSTYTLRCSATTDEVFELEYFWMKGGTQIDIEDSEYYEMDGGNLVIRNVQLMHAGEYTCVAQTTVDRAETSAQIDVRGPPGAPTGVTADIVSGDAQDIAVSIGWNPGADHFSEIIYYQVESRTNFKPEWMKIRDGIPPSVQSVQQDTRINGVSPWSTYEFRVVAQNELGFGEPSAPSEPLNTPIRKPEVAPSNVRGCCGGIGNLKIEWDPLNKQDWNGPNLRYMVEYKLKEAENDPFKPIETMEEGVSYVIVEGVPSYTLYIVTVRAKNGQGMGASTAVTEVYSYQEIPKTAPTNVAGTATSGSSVRVTWRALSAHFNGSMGGYKVKYWPTNDGSIDTAQIHKYPYEGTATELTGLSHSTSYTMVLVAFNGDNENGPDSAQFSVKTLKSPPTSVPGNLRAEAKGKTSMMVSWNGITTKSSEEPLSGYKVLYWKEGTFEQDAMVEEVDAQTRQVTIDALSKVTYLVKVRGYSAGGDGTITDTPVKVYIGSAQTGNLTGGASTLSDSLSVTFLFVLSVISIVYQRL